MMRLPIRKVFCFLIIGVYINLTFIVLLLKIYIYILLKFICLCAFFNDLKDNLASTIQSQKMFNFALGNFRLDFILHKMDLMKN